MTLTNTGDGLSSNKSILLLFVSIFNNDPPPTIQNYTKLHKKYQNIQYFIFPYFGRDVYGIVFLVCFINLYARTNVNSINLSNVNIDKKVTK